MNGRKITITGSDGFIGKNLVFRLREAGCVVMGINRSTTSDDWVSAVAECDVVVHLAATNRPKDPAEFERVNVGSTTQLIETIDRAGKAVPVIYASSTRALADDAYGISKRAAEDALLAYGRRTRASVSIFRLPNVFGKWARPNYNSAVATFCHNVARNLPITVNDRDVPLKLVYIDDVVDAFILAIESAEGSGFRDVYPVFATTVGQVADVISKFRVDRDENLIGAVGVGLTRALYATYVSALPRDEFSYSIATHRDPRGSFSEMLKTRDSGQFSYFTALPGVTRGGHYHHTKTEKFLIVHGSARFRFRNTLTGEMHEIMTSGDEPVVVETVPGWAHDVTNVGEGVLISLLWANEIFDRERPDTQPAEV